MSIDTFDDKARELADFTDGVRFLLSRMRLALEGEVRLTEDEQEVIAYLCAWYEGWKVGRRSKP